MRTDPEILEIPVTPRQASFASSVLPALGMAVLVTVLPVGLIGGERDPEEIAWILILSAFFGTVLAALLFAFVRQKKNPSLLRIEPDQIRLQDTVQGGEVALTYRELRVAHKEGRGGGENLVFKARETSILIGTAFLPEARAADSILEAVRERIALLPDGPPRLAGIEARQVVAERLSSGRKTAVLTVSVILGLIFLAQLVTGTLADPFQLWAFGANSYPLVRNGELFRLATANVLHGSFPHFLFNVIALVSFGSFLEPLLGTGRFLSVLLISALVGAAGSAFLGHHALALGASTGIAGLVAAYALILWLWPDRLSNPPTRGTWLWLAFAFVWPALTFQNVDHMAHLTGFLAGLAVVFPEIRKVDLAELASRHRALFRVIAALLVTLFLAAGGTAVQQSGEPQRDLKVAATLLHDTSLPPVMLNNLAWEVATSPTASREHLATALRAIDRLIESDTGTAELRDTHATVLYRLGRWEEAVRLEYELLSTERTAFRTSQLARFEWALVRDRGPLFLGQPPPADRARGHPAAVRSSVRIPTWNRMTSPLACGTRHGALIIRHWPHRRWLHK